MAANHIKIQLHLTTEGPLQCQACSSIVTCLTFLQKIKLKMCYQFQSSIFYIKLALLIYVEVLCMHS